VLVILTFNLFVQWKLPLARCRATAEFGELISNEQLVHEAL
jgi:hypothetical protein